MTCRITRRLVGLAAAALTALTLATPASGSAVSGPPASRRHDVKAPVVAGRDAIGDRYVVVFDKDAPSAKIADARRDAKQHGAKVHHQYGTAVRGFSATLTPGALERLRQDPRVRYIEADRRFTASDVQTAPPWGLDRIDQRSLPRSNTYTFDGTGGGVKVYVIDTGIRKTHAQFAGRVVHGRDTVDGSLPASDCNGHGTHVAGTVGASTFGVAKGVTLVAVRVLNCHGDGTTSRVLAGIDWVTRNHAAGQPAVANMSLGGPASNAIDAAVRNSINDGVTYVVAAGNENRNACNVSPARLPAAITVGATTPSDARASFSNFGSCLDVFAPGSTIVSAWHTSDTATRILQGTSMAAPHAAGVAALYLQGNASAAPAVVHGAIVSSATAGVITGHRSGSPNRLLYSLLGPEPPPPPGCSLPESYGGTLDGTGDYDDHPNGVPFEAAAGTHHGCLRGPVRGADFDLYLWHWDGTGWVIVAGGESNTASEDLTYTGPAGHYVWEVRSFSGSGDYTFAMQRP